MPYILRALHLELRRGPPLDGTILHKNRITPYIVKPHKPVDRRAHITYSYSAVTSSPKTLKKHTHLGCSKAFTSKRLSEPQSPSTLEQNFELVRATVATVCFRSLGLWGFEAFEAVRD